MTRGLWLICALVACSGEDDSSASADDAVQAPDSDVGAPAKGAGIAFTDATGLLGIAPSRALGVAIVDFDGDGWPDITIAALDGVTLHRNRGDGTFERVQSDAIQYLHSAAAPVWVDVDGDGDLDLFVSAWGAQDSLLLNDGTGQLEDVSELAGFDQTTWSEGASFADLDGDGDLDLLLAGAKLPDEQLGAKPVIGERGSPNMYWRNDGGVFTNATAGSGLGGNPTGESFGSLLFDADGDGDIDALIVNDHRADELLFNDGQGTFSPAGDLWLQPDETGLMGLDLGDVDGDGDLDVFSTNWGTDYLLSFSGDLYPARYWDVMEDVLADGVNPSINVTGWGCAVADLDNDGDQDLIATAAFSDGDGHETLTSFREGRVSVLRNEGLGLTPGGLVDVSDQLGASVSGPLNGFGLSVGDFDRDGDLDVMVGVDSVIETGGAPGRLPKLRRLSLLMRNDGAAPGTGLTLRLRQPDHPNPFAVGARTDVTAGGRRASRVVSAGASYLSAHTYGQHFGMGTATVATARITWPDGHVQLFPNLSAGEHTLARSAEGTCCLPDSACLALDEGACLARARFNPGSKEDCAEVCGVLTDCGFDRDFGTQAACVEQCGAIPPSQAEVECVQKAPNCSAVAACIGR